MPSAEIAGDVPVVAHWIDGKLVEGSAARRGDVFDPATGRVTKHVAFASPDDVDAAVEAASAAFAEWRSTSLAERTKILFRFRELLDQRAEALAAIITAEHGKVLNDAMGEVARGLEVVELACGLPQLLKGDFSEGVSARVDVTSIRQPLGVVAVISPFNFPAMVPCWFFPIAIAAGNAVILKPSEKDPSAANWIAELWAEAGLPAGVFNVVHGDKVAVDRLLEHPEVKAVSFVGSTPIARYVYETGTRAGKRVQALGGAKNHMVVLPDADLDLAADSAVNAGFGSAGERCMAISAVVAVDPVADVLVAKIAERISGLTVGNGRAGADMGPLITSAHRERVTSYLDAGVNAGATMVVDGREHTIAGDPAGFWLGPTLFDNVTPEMALYTDEIFGPVLSVIRVGSYDDALALVNANPYGNGAAIFTNDGGAARRFQNEVEAGMVGINVPIPVPVAYYSFGGWKSSLFGDTHAYGADGVHFFTRAKVVTSRWLDPSHGGVNLGFPRNT
ncbi:MAG: malonate-semialdehyde dehydrogenase (acetylating) / methylmalonate-semialdehyde dehydrogenase [Actinomycetota bacterium]|jgi:malonate-semialdehyde dehydrogenase (acetylating)/methylmalonate-semialdehyde dehydrogenase|nr:malonate-semialdehyde dehydrogenase (acetylating) / methylmalonate-semialdehyde dehydrogenase [Actinomycetota bacterium]